MKTKHLFAAAIGLSALAGCGPYYDRLDFAPITSPPLPVVLQSTGVEIPEGIAVAVAPKAVEGDGTEIEDVDVSILSSNPSVLGIDRAEDEGFVIFGARAGQATISVFVDGEQVDTIPALVTEQ